jgi:drug/metabolite transporter (DMT)-like permease
MLSVLIVCVASAFQVARNAAQRGLMGDAGPWGATLVRFLFGLPFAVLLMGVAWLVGPHPAFHLTRAFWLVSMTGAVSQVLATAALLTSMRRAGFAVGTAWQQSSMPLTAILGWLVFHDALSPIGWIGVALASLGLAALAAPEAMSATAEGRERLWGAFFGALSGLCFGFALNAYRHATLIITPGAPVLGATATVSITQAAQSIVLAAILAWKRPAALRAVLSSWRASLWAGFCGACASASWLTALGMTPAAVVRAVGVVEAPMAAVAGRRLFAERFSLWQWAAVATTAIGVVLTALN